MTPTTDFVTAMQAQFKAWDASVDALRADSKKADGEARTAYAKRLKELRLTRNAAQKTLEVLRSSTGTATAQLQAGMQTAWDTMQKALEIASSDLRARPAGIAGHAQVPPDSPA